MTPRVQSIYVEDRYPTIPGSCACGCGKALPKRRRRWASDECAEKCWIETSILCGRSMVIRAELFKRDKGVCARCGRDTEREKRYWQETRRLWLWLAERDIEERVKVGTLKLITATTIRAAVFLHANDTVRRDIRRACGWNPSRQAWESHHKIAVAEGGGGCPISGYETLCIPCHREETWLLRKRLAERREKDALQPLLIAV